MACPFLNDYYAYINKSFKLIQIIGETIMLSRINFITFFILFFLVSIANSTVFIVNSMEDNPDNNSGDGLCDTGNFVIVGDVLATECTLRAAIQEVNQAATPSTINFDIIGCLNAICTITVDRLTNGNLPDIVKRVTIDGATQPGNAEVCSNPIETRSKYRIVVQGDGVDIGLRLENGSDNSVIRGLNVRNFLNNVVLARTNGSTIECNFIGTDETGMVSSGNNAGNGVIFVCDSQYNLIGGVDAEDGNLISGNDSDGIQFFSGFACGGTIIKPSRNSILGNYIGTNKLATAKINNTFSGISFFGTGGVHNNFIGKYKPQPAIRRGGFPINGNIIGGNDSGIYIDDESSGIVIQGNWIGTDKTGSIDLGNTFGGVDIISGSNNQIGDNLPLAANTIAYNSEGVFISGLSSTSNRIVSNSFFENFSQSIDIIVDGGINPDGLNVNDAGDIDVGANTLINHPDLLSAKIGTVIRRGGPPPLNEIVEVEFSHDGLGDASYNVKFNFYFSPESDDYQGRYYLGESNIDYDIPNTVVTDTFALPSGFDTGKIMVSATDNNENTSEFAFIDIANPDIDVFGNGISIANGTPFPNEDNNTEFGKVAYLAGAIEHTFTIQNNGVGPLNLTGIPIVSVSNSENAFSISQQPTVTELAAGASTTFTVSFDPTPASTIVFSTIIIENDSRTEDPFTFDVVGTGITTLSIAAVTTNANEGGTLQYQAVLDEDIDFDAVIDYAITGDVNASDFNPVALSGQVTILNGSNSANIDVLTLLDDVPENTENLTITISTSNNNIAQSSNLSANGKITDVEPIIELSGNATTISNGDMNPSLTDATDFGSTPLSTGIVEHIFTITNSGNGALNLTGNPLVAITGVDADQFSVSVQPPSNSIAPASSTTFTVAFDPTNIGLKTATISIQNNDDADNPFIFTVQGYAQVSLALSAGADSILEGDTYEFPVSLDAPADFDVIVDYVLSDGVEAEDFNPASLTGEVTIPAGLTSTIIQVVTVRDNDLEGLESLRVDISTNTPNVITTSQVTQFGVIDDRDFIFIHGFE